MFPIVRQRVRLMQWFGTNECMAIFEAGVNNDPVSTQVSSTGRNFDKFIEHS